MIVIKSKWVKELVDILFYILGGFIYAVGVTVFLSPNEISPGGFTGIATLVNFLSGFPTGIMLIILNVPLIIIAFIKFGKAFIFKTGVATVIVSLLLDITEQFLNGLYMDRIIASLFGGILAGLGLSLVLLRNATTGGADIIAKLINRKFPHITMGRIILISDALVILLASVVYENIETALYSVVAMYASSRIMDAVLYGADKGKIIYVITSKPNEICNAINNRLQRGVTKLSAVGGYTGEERVMLMCTVRIQEASAVHSIIYEYDEKAFIVVSDAGEIIGEGFKMQEKH